MLPDSETNTVYLSGLLPARHPVLCRALKTIFNTEKVSWHYLHNTKDIWCRDYMPLQIHAKSFLRYRYYPDYMRGQYEHLVTDIDTVQGIAFRPNQMKRTDYVLDGGNVVHHRHVACTTDKIYRENADVERQDLRRSLGTMLGVKLIVVPTEPYDAIGHADGMLRFIDDRTVVLNDYRDLYPAYHKRLSKVLAQAGLSTIVVPHTVSYTHLRAHET